MSPDPTNLLVSGLKGSSAEAQRTAEVRLSELEERVRRLEAMTFKRQGLTAALLGMVRAWPGPFNAMQVLETMHEKTPFGANISSVLQSLYKLERKGLIIRTHQGRGRVGNIWELTARPPDPLAARRNRQADYESGFRHIVRGALADAQFPKEFTLADLRNWMATNLPNVRVPYGSWSSTLYKLQQAGELVVLKKAHTVPLKVYGRGERVVMPTGEELTGLERAWKEFKENFTVEVPPTAAWNADTLATRAGRAL